MKDLRQIRVEKPCPMKWDELAGCEARRFCRVCKKHVHNLDVLSDDERKELLESGQDLCVRYSTPDTPDPKPARRNAIPLVAVAAGLATAIWAPLGDWPGMWAQANQPDTSETIGKAREIIGALPALPEKHLEVPDKTKVETLAPAGLVDMDRH